MDCRHFERQLEALSLGTLPEADRGLCEAHAASCAACAELLTLATLPTIDGGPELVASVLEETSGAACDGVAQRLPQLRAGELSVVEGTLVADHVAQCAECRALASVLARLERELPRLAEVRPDARFVEDVLRRTLPVHVQLRRWWAQVWPRWLHRPRFASEAAFIGLLALLLVFATPGSPLEAVPRQALAVARQPAQNDFSAGDYIARPFDAMRQTAASSTQETVEGLIAARSRTAAKADAVVSGASEKWATFWREAASLLGNDGAAAAPESPDRPETNEENP